MTQSKTEKFYKLFSDRAISHGGVDAAVDYFDGLIPDELLPEFQSRFDAQVNKVGEGGPVIKGKFAERWYPGASDDDLCWAGFRRRLIAKGREAQIPELNDASDTIVSLTPNPSGSARFARGLVVGFVQSGKTTNFTAVAAKLVDRGYKMVIVLAGIHNALRSQTQQRLNADLTEYDLDRWFRLTDENDDFNLAKVPRKDRKNPQSKHDAASYLTTNGKASLLVVKKNATVLRKLRAWLQQPNAKQALQSANVLVIDDEADQASVESATINPLIRDIIRTFSRGAYIGYTATPFANVFIDPTESDDLYPRDFIYPLPRPEGYFGPEMLFGREVLGSDQDNVDGYDMTREIPEGEDYKLRPTSKDDVDGFVPVMTSELKAALRWFILATSARRVRGDQGDSSMLIHTSFQTQVHESFRAPLNSQLKMLSDDVAQGDPAVLDELRKLWESEAQRVPASDWGRVSESFEELLPMLSSVLEEARVIIDNYRSEERLSYEGVKPNTVIAVGGNTLSRGITLEGLVSSIFIRPTNTYDTLLQMGRWFGFRIGYEDLPRIWMTPTLSASFRHLSLVEHEMRQDMEVYELQDKTPEEVAVKIRTHPALRVTAKMGAASPVRVSFSGTRLQTRFFCRYDRDWLTDNWNAAEHLLSSVQKQTDPSKRDNGTFLFRNISVSRILNFLTEYTVHPDQVDMNLDMISQYIRQNNNDDDPQLTQWNVALIAGTGKEQTIADLTVPSSIRAPYKGSGDRADIKTLMSKQDLVVDASNMSVQEAKGAMETELKNHRMEDPALEGKGLLVLYLIDPRSEPRVSSQTARETMDAVATPVGLGLAFPANGVHENDKDGVRATHLSVEKSLDAEQVDTTDAMFGGEVE